MVTITPLKINLVGPFAIHGYGIMVALAIVVFAYLSYRHFKQYVNVSFDTIASIMTRSSIIGLLGGRILHILSDLPSYSNVLDAFALWKGGLSILGCMIALVLYVPYELKKHSLPLLLALDTAALYAPLAHAIGRMGCLWAGCCFGCHTSQTWAQASIIYQGETAGAPVGMLLHPAQLYSSIFFVVLFFILFVVRPRVQQKGIVALLYILGMSIERFMIDFIRADRIFTSLPILSLHQCIALALIVITGGLLVYVYRGIKIAHTPL